MQQAKTKPFPALAKRYGSYSKSVGMEKILVYFSNCSKMTFTVLAIKHFGKYLFFNIFTVSATATHY